MMDDMSDHDDLAEFETTEADIDAMLDEGDPVEVNVPYGVLVTPTPSYTNVPASDRELADAQPA